MLNRLTFKLFHEVRSLSVRGERGQDLIEYSMLGGLLAAAILAVAYLVLTGAIDSMFGGIGNCIDWEGSSPCLPN